MKRSLWGAAAFAFMIAVNPVSAHYNLRPYDGGGSVFERWRAISVSGMHRHAISGDCMSACTMWLGHRATCIEPSATLWFHAASYKGTDIISGVGTAMLRASYPPRLRAYVDARGWLLQLKLRPMAAATAIALGVPPCR